MLVFVFGWFGTKIGDIWGHFYGMNESEQPAGGLLDLKIVMAPIFRKNGRFWPKMRSK